MINKLLYNVLPSLARHSDELSKVMHLQRTNLLLPKGLPINRFSQCGTMDATLSRYGGINCSYIGGT